MSVTAEDLRRFDIGITMAVSTLVEVLGMHWENRHKQGAKDYVPYGEESFEELRVRNGCHWNEVIARWQT